MNAIEALKQKVLGMPDEVVITINTQQAKVILDQLEAERQQRESAEAELAELRGEQEPVEISGAMALAFHSATTDSAIGNDDVDEIKSGLKAVQDIFTRQPKPVVVLPRLTVGEVMHRSGFDRQYPWGWVSANDWAINELKASGIVVKDGE